MSTRTLPDHDAWIERFKAYRDFAKAHGRLPQSSELGGPEDTLRTWLERQRRAEAAGYLDASLAAILRTVKGALPRKRAAKVTSPKPASKTPVKTVKKPVRKPVGEPVARQRATGAERLKELEDFYRIHGRLPRCSGKSEEEKKLWRYLNNKIRVRYRSNSLLPYELDRLIKIPGVFQARDYKRKVPAPAAADTPRLRRIQADLERTEELIGFVAGNGRLPRAYGPDREPTLYNFLRKRIRVRYQAGTLDDITVRRLSTLEGVLVPSKRPRPEQAVA